MNVRIVASYVGLTLFSAITIGCWFNANDVEMLLFFGTLISCLLLPVLLIVLAGIIIVTDLLALFYRRLHDLVCLGWTVALIFSFALIPEYDLSADPFTLESYYEHNKEDLWTIARSAEAINSSGVVVRADSKYDSFYVAKGLSETDFYRLKDLLKKDDYVSISCSDSCCHIGFRYLGLDLYGYLFAMHEKTLEDRYDRILYNDSVAFEHKSGAVGSELYPGKDEYLKKKGETQQ